LASSGMNSRARTIRLATTFGQKLRYSAKSSVEAGGGSPV
jgi:hypothetical protein